MGNACLDERFSWVVGDLRVQMVIVVIEGEVLVSYVPAWKCLLVRELHSYTEVIYNPNAGTMRFFRPIECELIQNCADKGR